MTLISTSKKQLTTKVRLVGVTRYQILDSVSFLTARIFSIFFTTYV